MGYTREPIPDGLTPPMCFCGDPCKVERSAEDDTWRQRYWMCANWAFDPLERAVQIGKLEPPPLCDFEEWIDTEIDPLDKRVHEGVKEINEEIRRRCELRRKEVEAQKQHKEEERRRKAAKCKAEREKKLERARRAKAALEENPDALRKGKWPRCTQ
ncbi:unnamed protein product [Urochloa decumbens]|uniref:Uncharacterized protein n=1 Tax=Urochloa decumbens TaxID=240449 RepID=A0ABC8WU04_9POAL